MKAVAAKMLLIVSTVTAFLVLQGGASAAVDLVAPLFEKVKGQGVPIAGRVMRDNSADVDVYASGKIMRFHFDKDGKMTSAVSPLKIEASLIEGLKFTAADAAKAATEKADPRECEIRAVALKVEGGVASYCAASYDAAHRFLGYHRFLAADGRWEGWCDGAGEPDPIP